MGHKNERAFTLIELLITLTIITFIIAISSPLLISLIEKQTEKQFLAILEQDVLLLQNSTLNKYEYNRIIFRSDHYEVVFNNRDVKNIVRYYPKNLSISYNNTSAISFNHKGIVTNPGTALVQSDHMLIELIFPFGRGRFYVQEL